MGVRWLSNLWRRPTYLVHTSIPAYLRNALLGSRNPHTHTDHSDRQIRIVISADEFAATGGGARAIVASHPVWTLANGAQVDLVAVVEIPKGLVSIDSAAAILIEPLGAVAAGDAMMAITVNEQGSGDAVSSEGLVPAAVAIPAENAGANIVRVLGSLSTPVGLSASPRYIRLHLQRDATLGADSFEDLLSFVALELVVTVDQ